MNRGRSIVFINHHKNQYVTIKMVLNQGNLSPFLVLDQGNYGLVLVVNQGNSVYREIFVQFRAHICNNSFGFFTPVNTTLATNQHALAAQPLRALP